jgi:filamentous hemagglutinin family protein
MRNRSCSLKALLWLELGLAVVSAAAPQVASAAGSIKTDGSVGSAQTLAGPNYLIPQSLGTLSGNNLFHSFSAFNVGTGESATFTTITPTLANVISRVTGGSASQINGLIQLLPAGGAPNFYFINPAGVTFGAGSSINVPAAFHVTTAQYLKFPDGNFYADPAQTSTFSAAAPIAFGFLGNSRASVIINNGTMLGPQNATFQIVAGDVMIDNASVWNQAGDVRIVAMGNVAAEVGMSGTTSAAAGSVKMSNGGYVFTYSVDSTPAGNVSISAGSIGISGAGSGVFSEALGSAKAGNIDIRATQSMSISNGGTIESDSGGMGNGGAVSVSAGSLIIDGQSSLTGISSNAFSTGNSGSVQVIVDGQASISNAGAISTSANLNSSAGGVAVSAGSLLIDGQSNGGGISSSSSGLGNAGSVQVSVAGQATMINTGTISALAFGTGNGGSVTLSAGSLLIDGRGSYAGIVNSPFGLGTSGPVQVSVTGQASIINGGTINSNTISAVDAGSVTDLAPVFRIP